MLDTIINSLADFSRDGGVPYSLAAFSAHMLGLSTLFVDEYGPAEEWVDPFSDPISVDLGELISWLEERVMGTAKGWPPSGGLTLATALC